MAEEAGRVPLRSPDKDLEQQLAVYARAQDRMGALLEAVLAVSRELELPVVLRRIIDAAMELVDARYGALGVLDEEGRELAEFIPVGLGREETADLAGVDLPHGKGLLGQLIHHPEPLRATDIPAHSASSGFPAGHPPMRTLLGVAISARGRVYGNLYLADRRDGGPFDDRDEAVVTALAGAAGIAVENARLYQQVRANAEHFQRLLLPRISELAPFEAAAVYLPATSDERGLVGGDWYDALLLPDEACAVVIGDVVGHDLTAAATMSQTRNMLRALLYDRRTPPSAVLTRLDHTLHAITDNALTTVLLAHVERAHPIHAVGGPGAAGEPEGPPLWRLRWSPAGHPPPLLLTPDGRAEYLHGEPGLPLGVEASLPRPDHTRLLPGGSTLVLFTDGLVEHREHLLDTGLDALAALAATHAHLPLEGFCRTLAEHRPGDGHDDLAILALRLPIL